MGIETNLPAIITIITAAVVNSLSPCVVGVLVLVISAMIAAKAKVQRLLGLGLVYIFTITIVYWLAGFGLGSLFKAMPLYLSHYFSVIIALLVIAAGLIGIKDYFWYNEGFTLAVPNKLPKQIHHIARQITVWNVVLLGIFIAIVQLPCTGPMYLAVVTLLSQSYDLGLASLLWLYNLVFALPLVIILLLVTQGFKLHKIKAWKQSSRAYMRLAAGLLLVAMGWLLLLTANGTINFG